MYYKKAIDELIDFILERNGIGDKSKLSIQVKERFQLIKDRSVFYCEYFAIRFCKAQKRSFGNTVLALSNLQKYDSRPFLVCLVTANENYIMLANTTFLKKISHSSQTLRMDNIKGSFNGSDIMNVFENVKNEPKNFEFLYTSHENYSFEENLARLVMANKAIVPTGKKFEPNEKQLECIMQSVKRAKHFLSSKEYEILEGDLQERVRSVASEIVIASLIENVNLRGRVIEYLITSPDYVKATLIDALHNNSPLPDLFTADKLGDYEREFESFVTATDIKTKILFLSSNPKGYNIDKLLEFLSASKSVYLIYIVGISAKKEIKTVLCSMYNDQLREGTRIIRHWAGLNSRGVTQYDGNSLEKILFNHNKEINENKSLKFLEKMLSANSDYKVE